MRRCRVRLSVSRSVQPLPFGGVSAAPFFTGESSYHIAGERYRAYGGICGQVKRQRILAGKLQVSLELSAETAAVPFFTSTVAGTLVAVRAVMEDEPRCRSEPVQQCRLRHRRRLRRRRCSA